MANETSGELERMAEWLSEEASHLDGQEHGEEDAIVLSLAADYVLALAARTR